VPKGWPSESRISQHWQQQSNYLVSQMLFSFLQQTPQKHRAARSEGENTGFFMKFAGGEEDRRGDIEFICDPNGGTGTFATGNPVENPIHDYHLKWITQFACPTGSGGDGGGGGGGGDGDDGGISGGWIFIIMYVPLKFFYRRLLTSLHQPLFPSHPLFCPWRPLPGLLFGLSWP
jgi:hypothetical protein